MPQDFRQLEVWTITHQLTLDVYRVSAAFPGTEQYGLISQLRRAAASIPANIAEGCGRGTNPELARFLQIARGSASELEYHLLLAHDLTYLPKTDYDVLNSAVERVKKMLTGLIKKVNNSR